MGNNGVVSICVEALGDLVEKLAEAAERHVEAKMSGEALEAHRDAGYEDDRWVTR
jgi:hypothetical protein